MWPPLSHVINMNTLRKAIDAIRRWRWTEFQLLIVPALLGLIGMALVAATLVFGKDLNGSGIRLWFSFGFFSFQPSELLKVILVIFVAGYLYDRRDLLGSSLRVGPFRLPPLDVLLPLVLIW